MSKAYYADMTRLTLNGANYHQESGPHSTRQEAYDQGVAYLESLGLCPEEFTIEVDLFDIPEEV